MGGHDNIIKLLKLLMKLNLIRSYWFCVHTNEIDDGVIKLVKSDGSTEIYNRPIPVSDLTKQFPKHMVCRSGSFFIGQKIPALSESDRLLPGNKYFLLPKPLFQSVLSFVTVASLVSSQEKSTKDRLDFRNGSCTSFQPFHIQKGPSGCLRIRVSDDFISQMMTGSPETTSDEKPSYGKVCTTEKLQKDYAQLVGFRQWKPKLETIRENSGESCRRKIYSSFGIKRSQKSRCERRSDHQMASSDCYTISCKSKFNLDVLKSNNHRN